MDLLTALACGAGCTTPVVDVGVVPNPDVPAEARLAPAALVPTALVDEFASDAPSRPLCGDPLLGNDFSLDESELPTLFVDAAANAAVADGSLATPFRTLTQALGARDAASGSRSALAPRRRVLVASGHYDEDVAIPPGTLLSGGYDSQSWQPAEEPSVIGGSVYVGTVTALTGIVTAEGFVALGSGAVPSSPRATPLTALIRFEVSGGVEVAAGARALLRDNVIAPLFFAATGDPIGTRRAMAVLVDVATVRADKNRLVVPASDPASIISSGFFTWNSCAWITENQITDYRSPIHFQGGAGVAATFNVLRRAENGVGTSANQALIAGNSIHTYMPLPGCVYAVNMTEDAHPDIRDNTIYLSNPGNRGILETDSASRPTALLGNRFYSSAPSAALYMHHRGAGGVETINSVDALNALPGVPELGGNTFARAAALP